MRTLWSKLRASIPSTAILILLTAYFVIPFGSGDALCAEIPQRGQGMASIENAADNHSVWLSIGITFLAIALFCSVAISFYLYRWRRILLSNPHMLVPEELGEHLTQHEKALTKLRQVLSNRTKVLDQRSVTVNETLQNMVETFMTLQRSIDEKDGEIKRLKAGYDAEIFRRYLYRFVRVHQAIVEIQEAKTFGTDELELLRRLLEDAMDECGVEEFSPEIGADIREVEGIAENPKTIHTEQSSQAFKIAEVRETGYRYRTQENGYEVIVPAKVTVAMLEQGG